MSREEGERGNISLCVLLLLLLSCTLFSLPTNSNFDMDFLPNVVEFEVVVLVLTDLVNSFLSDELLG